MEASNTLTRPPEPTLPPSYWNALSQEDKSEFIKLRNRLHQSQKTSVKDRRLVSFSNEMTSILNFLERSEVGREQRCVLAGVAFAGPFICVNTRQLKSFLGRCKSSINGSFQQLGYVAVRTKSKARICVLSIMPTLANEPNLLRQWTVRGASEDAHFCFVSKFQPDPLPAITAEDLNDDRKQNSLVRAPSTPIANSINRTIYRQQQNQIPMIRSVMGPAVIQQQQIINQRKKGFDFDFSAFSDLKFTSDKIPDMTSSYSMDILTFDDDWTGTQDLSSEWNPTYDRFTQKSVVRSQSAIFPPTNEWATEESSPSLYFEF